MDRDIRFSDKKVDESWKEQATKDRGGKTAPNSNPSGTPAPASAPEKKPTLSTSKAFLNFITSLGYQAMMHLGEIPNPETQTREVNLEAAKEIIDLLIALQQKTAKNLSIEEENFFSGVLPELQLHFAQKS